MSAKDRTSWFWSDWAGDPKVRALTPAERGMWIDLLCLAADGTPKGYVTDAKGRALSVEAIARFANCGSAEASELVRGILEKGAASRDRAGRLFNRRMVRDDELSAKRRAAGVVGGNASALRNKHFRSLADSLPDQVLKQNGTRPYQVNKTSLQSPAAARARPPPMGQAEPSEGQPMKSVARLSRGELEASFAARKAKKMNGAPPPPPADTDAA